MLAFFAMVAVYGMPVIAFFFMYGLLDLFVSDKRRNSEKIGVAFLFALMAWTFSVVLVFGLE